MGKLFFTLLLSLMALTSNAQVMKQGDLNHDNQVNITDIVTMVDNVLHGKSPILVSFSNETMTVGSKVTIPTGGGCYNVQSSDANVASAIVDGSTIVFAAIGVGTASVTVADCNSGETATIKVTVVNKPQSYLSCPDDHHPHMIDLGLPSGTKWACCNVGADKPEAYGGFYAWGETEEKGNYDLSTYIHCDGSYDTYHNIGSDIAGTQYDVAHVKWGGTWVMPSNAQQVELVESCTFKWTTVNGINGRVFIGSNGNSIFMPAAGRRVLNGHHTVGIIGHYWSSTQDPKDSRAAYMLNFESNYVRWQYYYDRYRGLTVRPVSR
ncbi:MAG: hypothetical protein IKH88_07730 [Prevotella sp.]|nr:hypothetical protein [Prevotella sp.]